jgi:thioredoxin
MNTITDGDFESAVLGGKAVLVDFWAAWCGPCRQLAPVLEALQTELAGRVTVVKLNVDENPGTASRYDVSGLPTVILFVNGEPVQRIHGLKPKGALRAALEPWIS